MRRAGKRDVPHTAHAPRMPQQINRPVPHRRRIRVLKTTTGEPTAAAVILRHEQTLRAHRAHGARGRAARRRRAPGRRVPQLEHRRRAPVPVVRAAVPDARPARERLAHHRVRLPRCGAEPSRGRYVGRCC